VGYPTLLLFGGLSFSRKATNEQYRFGAAVTD
jgi:hypothetical protein